MLDPICLDPVTPQTRWRPRRDDRPCPPAWRWPLPRLARRDPVAIPVPEHPRHALDIGYGVHDLGGPLFVPVYAVQTGEVTFASETSEGFVVSLRHEGGVETHYLHLDRMFVLPNLRRTRRLEPVRGGAVIGYAARSPVHVRFELWEPTFTQGPGRSIRASACRTGSFHPSRRSCARRHSPPHARTRRRRSPWRT